MGTPLAAPADMWRRLSRALLPAARPAQEAR
jgi:hypothetical protein